MKSKTEFNEKTFRVAHVFKDENGNYSYKEAWLIDKAPRRPGFVTVVYVDEENPTVVPAIEVRVLGVSGNKIHVAHMITEKGRCEIKNAVLLKPQDNNLVSIIYDGETKPVDVDPKEIVLIGEEMS